MSKEEILSLKGLLEEAKTAAIKSESLVRDYRHSNIELKRENSQIKKELQDLINRQVEEEVDEKMNPNQDMQTAPSFLAVPKLEPFTGADPEVRIDYWLEAFEDVCKTESAGPELKLTLLRMLLRGPAKTKYRRYQDEVKNDAEQLKSKLLEDYSRQRNKMLCMLNFQNRKQKLNETVIEYASALENLFNMAFGNIDTPNDKAMIRMQFIDRKSVV